MYRQQLMPFSGHASLGAPAVSSSQDPGKGLSWLKEFLNLCTGCQIDFVPVHWYGWNQAPSAASQVGAFQKFLQDAHDASGGKQIWVTEV